MRCNGYKLKDSRFKFLTARVVRHWMNRLFREDVNVPSLKMFKARLDGAYGHPVHSRELELDSPYVLFFNPSHSVILWSVTLKKRYSMKQI